MEEKDKNGELLADFVKYATSHPDLRFWQALRAWAVVDFIRAGFGNSDDHTNCEDTFYWEGRND